jgi:hypothetical protein
MVELVDVLEERKRTTGVGPEVVSTVALSSPDEISEDTTSMARLISSSIRES